MSSNRLTPGKIKAAKARSKPYKLPDGDGLNLHIPPSGVKVWRQRYFFLGEENTATIGRLDSVTLDQARKERDRIKADIAKGIDPSRKRRRMGATANDFESVARRWHEINTVRWTENHQEKVIKSLELDVFDQLGKMPISEISAPDVLRVLRRVESRGALETTRKLKQRMGDVFQFAIGEGICETDPASMVGKALKPMPAAKRQPAVTTIDEARAVLMDCDGASAGPRTRLALRLLALTAVRPGDPLLGATWAEFNAIDRASPVWLVPAARMKMTKANKEDSANDVPVPLSRQALEIIDTLRPLTSGGPLAFPSTKHAYKQMSPEALRGLLYRAGYSGEHVPHGWRSTFSTVMNEMADRQNRPGDRTVIDLMVSHTIRGVSEIRVSDVEGRYNRAIYMQRRQELAQEWADMLCVGLMPVAEMVQLPRRLGLNVLRSAA